MSTLKVNDKNNQVKYNEYTWFDIGLPIIPILILILVCYFAPASERIKAVETCPVCQEVSNDIFTIPALKTRIKCNVCLDIKALDSILPTLDSLFSMINFNQKELLRY
jgi:hypothetical protein